MALHHVTVTAALFSIKPNQVSADHPSAVCKMSSNGALFNLVAYDLQDAHLSTTRQSSCWTCADGVQDQLAAQSTFTYDLSFGDLMDCYNAYLTVTPVQHDPHCLRASDLIDRISFGTPDNLRTPLASYDGFVLSEDLISYTGNQMHVPIQLIFAKIPIRGGDTFQLRVRFKIPVTSTTFGYRGLFLDLAERNTVLSAARDTPYMAHGSLQRRVIFDSRGRYKLDLHEIGGPVTDMWISLHDESGQAVHVIDYLELYLNTNLFFRGTRFLCCTHLPKRLYGINTNEDRYYIPLVAKPVEEPTKGTVNFSRHERVRLCLQATDQMTGTYNLRLSWRYHNVLHTNAEGTFRGPLYTCGDPVAEYIRYKQRLGSEQYTMHGMESVNWTLPPGSIGQWVYVITEDILDPAAVICVNISSKGEVEIEQKTNASIPDVELVHERKWKSLVFSSNVLTRALPSELVHEILRHAAIFPNTLSLVNKSLRMRSILVESFA